MAEKRPDGKKPQAPTADHPEQTEHNLENVDKKVDQEGRPVRSQQEADFAAEAHGFTGFESAGKGADYKSGNREKDKKD